MTIRNPGSADRQGGRWLHGIALTVHFEDAEGRLLESKAAPRHYVPAEGARAGATITPNPSATFPDERRLKARAGVVFAQPCFDAIRQKGVIGRALSLTDLD